MTSKDGYLDAHEVAAQAMEEEASKDPQTDVDSDEPEETVTGTEETETTDEDNSLSDEQVKTINSFGKLSEDEKTAKITKMLNSGRSDQVEKAKLLQENFDIELETPKESADIDLAVAEALKKQGIDPETISELKEKKELQDMENAVKTWTDVTGLNPKKVLRDRAFIKAYHSSNKGLQAQVADGMKAYLETASLPNSNKAKATAKLSSTGKGKAEAPKKKESFMDVNKLIGGKSLDDIDLSAF